MGLNLFNSSTPQYAGSGNPTPQPTRSGLFGSVMNLFGGDQTPQYRTVKRVVVSSEPGGEQPKAEPVERPVPVKPVKTTVVTIIVEEYGDKAPSGDDSPNASSS